MNQSPEYQKRVKEAERSLQQYLEESIVIPIDPLEAYIDGFINGWTDGRTAQVRDDDYRPL